MVGSSIGIDLGKIYMSEITNKFISKIQVKRDKVFSVNSHLVALINCTDETKPFITSPLNMIKSRVEMETKLSWSKRFFMFSTFINFDEFRSYSSFLWNQNKNFSCFHRYTCYFRVRELKYYLFVTKNFSSLDRQNFRGISCGELLRSEKSSSL